MQVDQEFINALENKISKSRLDAYRDYFDCSNDAEAIGAYLWNKTIATAFYSILQATEITLRNTLHAAATQKFSGNKEWFVMGCFPNAKKEAEKRYYKGRGRGRQAIQPRPTPDSVIAQLTFGFWTDLLTSKYDDPVNNRRLWPSLIPSVFPNAHGDNATRAAVHQRFKFIKDFRNRVGHYEPLWKIKDTLDGAGVVVRYGPTTPEESMSRLKEYITLILEALKWMSFERHDFLIGIGLVDHLLEMCSVESLHHYQQKSKNKFKFNQLQKKILSKTKETGSSSGIYCLSTSRQGMFKGDDLMLEIKHIKPPLYKVFV